MTAVATSIALVPGFLATAIVTAARLSDRRDAALGIRRTGAEPCVMSRRTRCIGDRRDVVQINGFAVARRNDQTAHIVAAGEELSCLNRGKQISVQHSVRLSDEIGRLQGGL